MNTENMVANEEVLENVTENVANVTTHSGPVPWGEPLDDFGRPDIPEHNSVNKLKVAGCIGLAALGGFLAYRYIIKPAIRKRRAAKELNNDSREEFDTSYDEDATFKEASTENVKS